jgi:hypothetical protein
MALETASRANLSAFKIAAWMADLEGIPPARTLAVPEPWEAGDDTPSPARENSGDSRSTQSISRAMNKQQLRYKLLIHIDSVEEDEEPEDRELQMRPSSPISDQNLPSPPGGWGGSFGDGGRVDRSLPWTAGVLDRRGGGHHFRYRSQQRSYRQVAARERSAGGWHRWRATTVRSKVVWRLAQVGYNILNPRLSH